MYPCDSFIYIEGSEVRCTEYWKHPGECVFAWVMVNGIVVDVHEMVDV